MAKKFVKAKEKIDFGDNSRTRSFKIANKVKPEARANEIEKILEKVDPKPGETIVDLGCGEGILSRKMAEKVGPEGKIIALDTSKTFLEEVGSGSRYKNRIETRMIENQIELPVKKQVADKVVSLAGFHHVPDKNKSLDEVERVLKKGGNLFIADVEDQTSVQRFFDTFVDRYSSTGHKHRFLSREWVKKLFSGKNLEINSWENNNVPWEFKNDYQAAWFIHKIFDLQCQPEKAFHAAEETLGVKKDEKVKVNWDLLYLNARKESID